MRIPRPALWFVLVLVGATGLWIAVREFQAWQLRGQVARAREAQEKQRFGVARELWRTIADANPDLGEAWYELGVCELALNRPEEADAAWNRIDSSHSHGRIARARRGRVALLQGRLGVAESLLREAIGLPRTLDDEARWDLARVLRLQGRFAEARSQFVDGLAEAPAAPPALRSLRRLDIEPFPIEGVRQYVERAERTAASDPRVRLARAYLLSRQNRHEEARALLNALLKESPNDVAVWRVSLDAARVADQPDEVARAAAHLPADPAEAQEIRAWLAARRGDRVAECALLKQLLEIEPARVEAIERLAELDAASDPKAAEALRARKKEIEAARDAYTRGLGTPDPAALAALAKTLGLRDEERWWDALRNGSRPESPLKLPAGDMLLSMIPEFHKTPTGPGGNAPSVASPPPAPAPTGPSLRFVDVAEPAGVAFSQKNGDPGRKLTPPVTSSGGVALLDYDGDGWLDVYAVQGGTFPPAANARNDDRLFRNKGNGTFEDASKRSGIAAFPGGYGHGAAVGDVDNDGRPDLFLTRWRSYALYRNKGDGTFEDATQRYGLGGDRDWPTSAAFADLDGDGDLDLYVCHYLKWDENYPLPCVDKDNPALYHCSPRDFPSLPDHVFRNDGGRFVDVTKEAGFTDSDGRGLGVLAADLDGDGKIDLYVANDTTANYLFKNLGGFKFRDVAPDTGTSANASGGFQAGMGVASADLDGDGQPDLLVTNFYNESTTFFLNLGGGQFTDQTGASGIGAASRYLLGFGIAAADVDNDGLADIWTANGHVNDGRPQYPWMMPMQLLRNRGNARFQDVSARSGPAFAPSYLGRALAVGDLDNDGRLDAVMVPQNAPVVLARNESEVPRGLTIALEGKPPGSPRDAIGASVTVTAGGRTQVVARNGGTSYQSAPDPRLHVGLASAKTIDSLTVRWPSGHQDRYNVKDLRADSGLLLREGDATPRPLPGFPSR